MACLCLTILEAGKFKIKVLAGLESGESLPPSSYRAVFSLGPHMAEGVRDSFVRALVPSMMAPAS